VEGMRDRLLEGNGFGEVRLLTGGLVRGGEWMIISGLLFDNVQF